MGEGAWVFRWRFHKYCVSGCGGISFQSQFLGCSATFTHSPTQPRLGTRELALGFGICGEKKGGVGSKQYVTTPFRLVSYIYEKLSTGVTHLSLFTVAVSALQKGKRTICHCRRFFLQGTLPLPKILSSFLHPISSPLLSGPAYTRIG